MVNLSITWPEIRLCMAELLMKWAWSMAPKHGEGAILRTSVAVYMLGSHDRTLRDIR